MWILDGGYRTKTIHSNTAGHCCPHIPYFLHLVLLLNHRVGVIILSNYNAIIVQTICYILLSTHCYRAKFTFIISHPEQVDLASVGVARHQHHATMALNSSKIKSYGAGDIHKQHNHPNTAGPLLLLLLYQPIIYSGTCPYMDIFGWHEMNACTINSIS